jgi:hypothetical protein
MINWREIDFENGFAIELQKKPEDKVSGEDHRSGYDKKSVRWLSLLCRPKSSSDFLQ